VIAVKRLGVWEAASSDMCIAACISLASTSCIGATCRLLSVDRESKNGASGLGVKICQINSVFIYLCPGADSTACNAEDEQNVSDAPGEECFLLLLLSDSSPIMQPSLPQLRWNILIFKFCFKYSL